MKIAFDHQIFSIQKYGGISRYFVSLAEKIPQVKGNGVDLRIISPIYKNHYLSKSPGRSRAAGMKVPDFPKTGRVIRYLNNCASSYFVRRFRPDVIHETYYSTTAIGPTRIKRILTVYDMIHELFPEYFSENDPTRENKKVAVSRADHIICISENTKNDLINILGVDESKISVVNLGFEFSEFDLPLRREVPRPYLLFVGFRGGYKNFKLLVRAYASSMKVLKNLDLICFGGGPFSSDELKLFSEEKIPIERIRQVSGDDALLSRYYKNAVFFVYPSLYEGFGIPPLEAMSYGCPVACSNTSSIPEVVGDAAIMFDPYSIGSLQASLEKLFLDSFARETLISRGFAQIENYSWEKCARETLDIYNKVLS